MMMSAGCDVPSSITITSSAMCDGSICLESLVEGLTDDRGRGATDDKDSRGTHITPSLCRPVITLPRFRRLYHGNRLDCTERHRGAAVGRTSDISCCIVSTKVGA